MAWRYFAQNPPHITINLRYFLKDGDESVQLIVFIVVVPRDARQGVLGLVEVAVGRIVHNYDVLDRAAQHCQIFHKKVSLLWVKDAVLAVEAVVDKLALRVQSLKNGLSVTG